MEVTENSQDVVILRSDGIDHHFAHVVDDHQMGTTVVVRGEEWLARCRYTCSWVPRAMG